MDLADDIAYSTYDVEDAFKAGFLTPLKIMSADESIFNNISKKLKSENIEGFENITSTDCRTILWELFGDVWVEFIQQQGDLNKKDKNFKEMSLLNLLDCYHQSDDLATDGYSRVAFTSGLVKKFVDGIKKIEINKIHPHLSKVDFNNETKLTVKVLKYFTYESLINSSRLKIVENRGYEIIKSIFNKLTEPGGCRLLPDDFQQLYMNMKDDDDGKKRVICDFIAGMTDRYALEFYCRLYSENPETIFKPI
jgi:dGTP triphosphohydrolase